MLRFAIPFLLLLGCCGAYAREDSLTKSDLQAAWSQLALVVGKDAKLFAIRGPETGCHDLEPCTDVVDRYATFERIVTEPNPLVTRTMSVDCKTPPKKTNWSCASAGDTFNVPSLFPKPIYIGTGLLGRKSAALDDDTLVALVRYAVSDCYQKQKAEAFAKNHIEQMVPEADLDRKLKFRSIGKDLNENVYTISQRLGFFLYTVLVAPAENSNEECSFKIVGVKAAVI